MPTWAMTDPQAAPAIPMPRPWTSSTLSTALALNPTPATSIGVRVSRRPRRMPVAAMMTSSAGSPSALIRR